VWSPLAQPSRGRDHLRRQAAAACVSTEAACVTHTQDTDTMLRLVA
jgi:hypothetical protein